MTSNNDMDELKRLVDEERKARRDRNNEYQKEYRKTDKSKARLARYRERPEIRMKEAERAREFRADNPGVSAAKQKAYREGKQLIAAGRMRSPTCDACGRGAITEYDHNHVTGKFRGWLCSPCNKALGAINDDIRVLQCLIDYISRRE